MSCLYITESGAVIGVTSQRLEVKYKSGRERSIPIETLESIEIFGKSQMTAQAMQKCMERLIPVSFHSRGGYYLGKLSPARNINISRQRLQFKMTEDEEFSTLLAARIIKAKIHNQIVLLRRYARSGRESADDEIHSMLQIEHRIDRCKGTEEVMGCEGYAARQYFKGLGKLVKKEFVFKSRSKRPPKDEFNSLLSLGYTMLFHEIYAKIEKKGLNSYLGFLHQDKAGHPALVSDLIEEWRSVIVDATVMSLVNGNEIRKEHFQKIDSDEDGSGIYLNKDGMRIFINKMEQKMRTDMRYLEYTEYPVSFRQALDLQINRLVKSMEGCDLQIYKPVRIR